MSFFALYTLLKLTKSEMDVERKRVENVVFCLTAHKTCYLLDLKGVQKKGPESERKKVSI